MAVNSIRWCAFKGLLGAFVLVSFALLAGCNRTVPAPASIIDTSFPQVVGNDLNKKQVTIPDDFSGRNVLLLVGYEQRAQFDIDRWILGVLQADIPVEIVEVPTIAGMVPRAVQGFIDNGMRSGIPQSDWASVVTVYKDADKIIQALGNDRPQSAYAVLLNREGRIIWRSNIGYSAGQVIELKKLAQSLTIR